MRARRALAIAGLSLTFAPGAAAASMPTLFQRDVTFFHSAYTELNARHATDTRADSSMSSRTVYLAGGVAALGLAAYFVASSTSGPIEADFPSAPVSPAGDLLLPPQTSDTPPGTGDPGAGGDGAPLAGPGDVGLDVPTTVTPEPVSMALLASGLGGLGALNLRRVLRRR